MEFLNIYLYELKKETKPVALITIESDLIKNVLNTGADIVVTGKGQ